MDCPHCHKELSEDDIKRLWAEHCGKQTSPSKAAAAAANGRKGGRPVTYFRDVYDAVIDAVPQVLDAYRRWNQQHIFNVERSESADPIESGFSLSCAGIVWDCRWNRLTNHVEAFENGRQVIGYNTVNNSAKTAAKRLVEDIHRAKLMSMPEDNSDIADWIKRNTR